MSTLFWKEYREARLLVGLGMLAAAVIVLVGIFTNDTDGSLTAMFTIYAGWPLLAALCGAGAFANEVEGGTLPFLLSLPVARSKVWWSKFLSGLLTLFALMAGSLLLNLILLPLRPMPMKADMLDGETVLALLAGSLTVFAATFFFSALIGRALIAALAGLAFTGAMAGLCAATNVFLGDVAPNWYEHGGTMRRPDLAMLVQLFAVMGLCLFASRVTFVRGELLRSSRRLRVGLTTLVMPILLVTMLLAVPFYRSLTTLPIHKIDQITKLEVSPQGDRVALLVRGMTAWGERHHAWVIDAETGRAVDLGMAYDIAWSRDGERLACSSARGFLGIARKEPALVWMDANGAVRQKIRDEVYYFSYFSRSDTFLISVSDSANLPDAKVLDGDGKQVASLTNQPNLTWHPDGRSYYQIEPDGEGQGVLRRRYLNGKITRVAQCAFPQNLSRNAYSLQSQIAPNGKWLVFQSRFSPALYLAATDGSGCRVIREDKVGGYKWSADSRYLFVLISLPKEEKREATIVRRDEIVVGITPGVQQLIRNRLKAYDTATQAWQPLDKVPWTRGLDPQERNWAFRNMEASPNRQRLAWLEGNASTKRNGVWCAPIVAFDVQRGKTHRLRFYGHDVAWLDNERLLVTRDQQVWRVDLKDTSPRRLFPPR
jgi:hypothetical protein